jgi:hypothetical protein
MGLGGTVQLEETVRKDIITFWAMINNPTVGIKYLERKGDVVFEE